MADARCLVIGGSDENPYGDGFFEVGGHTHADYGAGMDWKDPSFWYGLWQAIAPRRFACAFFDRGSESWFHGMSQECMEAFAFVVAQLCPLILIEGQIRVDDWEGIRPMTAIRRLLEAQQDYQAKAFVRIERNAILYLYCAESYNPIHRDRDKILPMERLPRDNVIPSVTIMPYNELTPVKTLVLETILS